MNPCEWIDILCVDNRHQILYKTNRRFSRLYQYTHIVSIQSKSSPVLGNAAEMQHGAEAKRENENLASSLLLIDFDVSLTLMCGLTYGPKSRGADGPFWYQSGAFTIPLYQPFSEFLSLSSVQRDTRLQNHFFSFLFFFFWRAMGKEWRKEQSFFSCAGAKTV